MLHNAKAAVRGKSGVVVYSYKEKMRVVILHLVFI